MSKKRDGPSKSLLPYRVRFRECSDPKYDFSDKTFQPRKRSRISITSKKLPKSSSLSTHDSKFASGTYNSSSGSAESLPCDIAEDHGFDSFATDDALSTEKIPESWSMDTTTVYSLLLQQEKQITFSNYSSTAFVLQDFDKSSKSLDKVKYIVVERRGIQFIDCCKWVYWCSCDPGTATFLKTMDSHVMVSSDGFRYSHCIHAEVVCMLVASHDVAEEIIPEDYLFDPRFPVISSLPEDFNNGIFPIGTDKRTVCVYEVYADKPYGVVHAQSGKLLCWICSNKDDCNHVRYVQSFRDSNDWPESLDTLFEVLDQSKTPHCTKTTTGISWNKIPFELPEEIQDCLSQGAKRFGQTSSEVLTLPVEPCPAYPTCPSCGGEWMVGEFEGPHPLVTECQTLSALVPTRVCKRCEQVLNYDGQNKALLNMGKYLVSYDILRAYMHHFLHGRCPMNTYYTVLCEKHVDAGDTSFPQVFTYHYFRSSWYYFVQLLDIDYVSGFQCPKCLVPETIICDATSVAIRKELLQKSEAAMSNVSVESSTNLQVLNGSNTSERVFINNGECRRLLGFYSSTATSNEALKTFSERDMERLMDLLVKHSPALAALLKAIEYAIPCPSAYGPLLKSLSSQSPVCALLPPTQDVENLVNCLCSGVSIRGDPVLWKSLQNSIPVIFHLMLAMPSGTTSLPQPMNSVLDEMLKKSQLPFDKATQHPDTNNEGENVFCYFPTLNKCRDRGVFVADKQKKELLCCKDYRGHPYLLPGIFTMYCPHGICYGFQLMSSHESPNIPFTLMRTRFHRAPHTVIYDNGCNLHTYCLLRDPFFFKSTKFLVDRFHWSNHKGCSAGYRMDDYPQFIDLNSQINEQANAGIKRLKSQLSYMNFEHFMQHCKLYLWHRNFCTVKKLE